MGVFCVPSFGFVWHCLSLIRLRLLCLRRSEWLAFTLSGWCGEFVLSVYWCVGMVCCHFVDGAILVFLE